MVKGFGSLGNPERFFGPPLEDGNHLRWAFSHELGFPAYGFTIYRRTHVPGKLIELSNQHYRNDIIRFPEVVRRVVVELMTPQLHLRDRSILPSTIGLFENVPVLLDLTKRLGPRRISLELQGDAFDAIKVNNRARWKVSRVRYVPVSQDINQRWQKIKAICLPFTDPSYPCQNGNANPAADWQEAASRIPPQVRAHYLGEQANPSDNWHQLHESMKDLYNPPISSTKATSGYFELKQPSAFMQPLDIVLLATIDPYLSRMLGLYWIDSAHNSTSYDYKVVGNWAKDQIKNPEMEVNFDDIHVGQQITETFIREDLIFRCPSKGTIVKLIGTPWNDTRKALDLKVPPVFPRLVISFTKPVGEAQIYLRLFGGQPIVDASLISLNNTATGSITTKRWKSQDGTFVILTIGARNRTDRIEAITLGPAPNSPTIHIALCKIGILQSWSPPTDEEIAWVSYNVKSRVQPALSAPTGLEVKPIETPSRELAQDVTVADCMAGLNWKQPDTGEVPLSDQSVRYIVQRQGLGDGSTSSPIIPAQWKVIKHGDDTPVTAAIPEDSVRYKFVDDPAFAVLAENQTAERHYAYRIAGVDLFGRVGSYSEAVIVDLKDNRAPPPPINVEAEYLEDGNSRVRVRWKWPLSLRKQAPDAREFRVYLQIGRLNTITGYITEIFDNPDGTFRVMTDSELQSVAAEVLVGERIHNNDAYFMIEHNTGGTNFEIHIRPIGDSSRPITELFTISLRPRKLMAGEITKVRRHYNGTVTLRTDLQLGTESTNLDNKWLDQGGRQFLIKSSSSGSTTSLIIRSKKFPMDKPAIGGFTVLQEDGHSPLILDPGNPLFKDYLHPTDWAQRVVVEPISESVSYEVIFNFDDFIVPESEAVAYAHVGVTTADDKNYVADDDHWNETEFEKRLGNEGMVSTPVMIQKIRRSPLMRPTAPGAGNGVGTFADYYGNSRIKLSWKKQGRNRFLVYRALDQALFDTDQKARSTRPTNRDEYEWLSDDHYKSLVVELPNYRTLSDEQLQSLASLPGNEESFGLITMEPLDVEDNNYRDPNDPQGVSYEVVFNGRATNRYCFALKTVDLTGEHSVIGWSSRPVQSLKSNPSTPIITKILGGEKKITIKWKSSRDTDIREYRIYRASNDNLAHDLRLMNLIYTVSVPSDNPLEHQEEEYVDEPVLGLLTLYYRLVAVDKSGNVSEASAPISSMAFDEMPPMPPILNAIWLRIEDGIFNPQVTWSSIYETFLQQREANTGQWQSITSWLPSGEHSQLLSDADQTKSYEYRLWAKKHTGAVAIGAPILLEAVEQE